MGTLSSAQIEEILDKLNDDTDFRYDLVNDPGSVLDSYNISYDPNELPSPSQVELPDVGDVNADRDAYRDELFADDEFKYDDHKLKLSS